METIKKALAGLGFLLYIMLFHVFFREIDCHKDVESP